MESLLIEEIQRELAIHIPHRDGGVLRIDGPFRAYNLRITLSYILNISECEIARNLLLQRERGLGRFVVPTICGSMLSLLTPNNRCSLPDTGFATA